MMTKPVHLYLEDGSQVAAVMCGACGKIWGNTEGAETCCAPRKCKDCGRPVSRRAYVCCDECREAHRRERENEAWSRATKVRAEDWDGPVFVADDEFYDSVGDLVDAYYDEDAEPPEHVWGAAPDGLVLSASDILTHATDEMYEGAYDHIGREDVLCLQKILDAWTQRYGPPDGYYEDRTRAIVDIPWHRGET
jgi:hypothetical protein